MADKTHFFETSLKSCFFIFLKFASLIMVKKRLNTFRNSIQSLLSQQKAAIL